MEEIRSIAYEYYSMFYGYNRVIRKLWFNILLAIFSAGIFLACIVQYLMFSDFSNEGSLYSSGLLLVGVSEVILISSYERLKALRQNLIIGNSTSMDRRFVLMNKKVRWINDAFVVEPSHYPWLLKKIEELKAFSQGTMVGHDLSLGRFLRYIYDRESKARILSLALFVFSILALIAMKEVSGLDVLFETYSVIGWKGLVFLWMTCSIITFLLYVGVVYFLSVLVGVVDTLGIWLDRGTTRSDRIFGYLFRDLAEYSHVTLSLAQDKPK